MWAEDGALRPAAAKDGNLRRFHDQAWPLDAPAARPVLSRCAISNRFWLEEPNSSAAGMELTLKHVRDVDPDAMRASLHGAAEAAAKPPPEPSERCAAAAADAPKRSVAVGSGAA